ncbi:protein DA1-related 1-like isoform X1 [Syzygium oleosum]|uniref:protein DA1-related 1-like isoform X1 n=1 Tax=Syzygium oleosum TaxID=219896 RepID=UPI0024BAC6CF|nr:protein DA1-related 1-like isoform X1 [Syzygium oleosum]
MVMENHFNLIGFHLRARDDEYQSKYKQASKALLEIDKLHAKAQLVEDELLAIALQKSLNVEEDRSRHSNGNSLQIHPVSSSGSRICAGCKSQIGPEYFKSYMGADWHPECFRCHACDLPIEDLKISESGDHLYHESCYKEHHHLRCDVCKNYLPVNNEGFEYSVHRFWMQTYCQIHEQDGTPICCSCERMEPRDKRYSSLDDGRKLCQGCQDSAIMNTNACQPLYLEIQGFYHRMNMKVEEQIPLLLEARQELNDAIDGETNGHHHSHETRGLCVREGRNVPNATRRPRIGVNHQITDMVTEPYKPVHAILILYGLPRLLTGSVLAHEMMHAWLQLEGYPNLSPEVEEGICQVLAHMWLNSEINSSPTNDVSSSSLPSSSSSSTTSKKAKYSDFEIQLGKYFKHQIETEPSMAYGEGFRSGNKAVEEHGLRKTLDHIRLTGTYPL